ncbi:transposase [Bradyrhizobium sp. USDA 4452]
MNDGNAMDQVIQIDEARIRDHLGEIVRGTVEETLNAMLEAEADQLCGAGRYERCQARQDTRAGSYERTLHTKAGDVNLKVPKLRRQTFETAIIERYRRRESSVEEALIEMYLAGISVRRVEDITEALWGTRVSPSTGANLNKKIYAKIEAWRNRRIEGEHPYLYLDGIVMKRSWAGEVRNVSLLGSRRSMPRGSGRSLASVKAPRRTSPAGHRSRWACREGAGDAWSRQSCVRRSATSC